MPKFQQVPPFFMPLQPSRAWRWGVGLSWLAFLLLVILYLPAPFWLSAPVAAILLIRPYHAGREIQALQVDASGALWLKTPQGTQQAQVLEDSFVSAWLIVLNLRVAGQRRSVMIWPDSASAEARRQLRVYLLWFEPASPSPDSSRNIS